ncbi:MAG: electron transfer flavoprotein subunit beta/FixA family protein [Candidatus Riflebacteria bacterium]|nr:electron transfer flavoprotein subunit beta/FixA family protein [Candidatus Riflebacteria bacterium]
MKICVIVKRVPDTEANIKIRTDKPDRIDESEISFIINPYDEFAVEEALKIADEKDGETTVITVGSKESEAVLRHALAMGIENAVHVTDNEESDPFRTAFLLGKVINDKGFDLILCGKAAIDDDTAGVGSMLAENLGLAQVLVVTKVEIAGDGKKVVCHRDIEGGTMVVEAPLPAVISCQKGLNEPRLPTIIDIKRANKKALETFDSKSYLEGFSGPRVKIGKFTSPPPRPVGKVLKGDSGTAAKELAKLLREEAKVI